MGGRARGGRVTGAVNAPMRRESAPRRSHPGSRRGKDRSAARGDGGWAFRRAMARGGILHRIAGTRHPMPLATERHLPPPGRGAYPPRAGYCPACGGGGRSCVGPGERGRTPDGENVDREAFPINPTGGGSLDTGLWGFRDRAGLWEKPRPIWLTTPWGPNTLNPRRIAARTLPGDGPSSSGCNPTWLVLASIHRRTALFQAYFQIRGEAHHES